MENVLYAVENLLRVLQNAIRCVKPVVRAVQYVFYVPELLWKAQYMLRKISQVLAKACCGKCNTQCGKYYTLRKMYRLLCICHIFWKMYCVVHNAIPVVENATHGVESVRCVWKCITVDNERCVLEDIISVLKTAITAEDHAKTWPWTPVFLLRSPSGPPPPSNTIPSFGIPAVGQLLELRQLLNVFLQCIDLAIFVPLGRSMYIFFKISEKRPFQKCMGQGGVKWSPAACVL